MKNTILAKKIYDVLFGDYKYLSGSPEGQQYADVLTRIFEFSQIQKIERVLNESEDQPC